MQWMKTVLREIYGLFVDDAWFAVAILIWTALVWFMLRFAGGAPQVKSWIFAFALFAGLTAILLASTALYARKHPRK